MPLAWNSSLCSKQSQASPAEEMLVLWSAHFWCNVCVSELEEGEGQEKLQVKTKQILTILTEIQ